MITLVLSSFIVLYLSIIIVLIYGYTKVPTIDYIHSNPKTKFTIIVPFRNESDNLPVLLKCIAKLNYPTELFEVLLVDDESKERFSVFGFQFSVKVIKNNRVSNSPKKDAISTAMKYVNSPWVITTDADCKIPKNWLLAIDNYIQIHNVSMIAGAVTYECNNSFLHQFQLLDMASLQGATIGSFGIKRGFMCNGANLAYTKSLFEELNGFEGNDKIATGDDVFMLQKAIKLFPEKIHYLKSKNTIVMTKALDEWKSLFYQRVRWASKTTSYQSNFGKTLGLMVFMGNINILIAFALTVIGLFEWRNFIFFIAMKIAVDATLIYKSNYFLNTNKIKYLLLSSLIYPFFSVSVAIYSLSGKYEWKGRRF